MYKFLLIEDNPSDIDVFKDCIEKMELNVLKSDGSSTYELKVASNYDDGEQSLNDDFTGIIVDIKLSNDNNHDGNEIIKTIMKKYRVPAVVFTGTPDVSYPNSFPIKIYKKGEVEVETILNDLIKIYNTGMFKVLSGTGELEQIMTQIFWKNIYPHIDCWIAYEEAEKNIEKILLRYSVAHIQEFIDNEVPKYVTEEMYIAPPISKVIKTGSILKEKCETENYYIVLSPPCDLALHEGKFKTDCILLCKIFPLDYVYSMPDLKNNKGLIKKAENNSYTLYYHWLPKNELFRGGYINFREVMTCKSEEIKDKFEEPKATVQDCFVKSILCRFSSYYSRQGQPDFDLKK